MHTSPPKLGSKLSTVWKNMPLTEDSDNDVGLYDISFADTNKQS